MAIAGFTPFTEKELTDPDYLNAAVNNTIYAQEAEKGDPNLVLVYGFLGHFSLEDQEFFKQIVKESLGE